MELIIAEKPSVARDLARVLGLRPARGGGYEGDGRVLTFCVGHLVELEEPAAYDARWKAWRLDTLPMLPPSFKLRPARHAVDQLAKVTALLRDRRVDAVVNACDAGREGELIFRYLLEYVGRRLPARRLWISSLTDEAIRRGFGALRPAADFDPLGDAARARSEADWLVGMNATRAITVRLRGSGDGALLSIGRVQTPTLAMLVRREHEIAAFVPRDYWEVRAELRTSDGASFPARWTHGRATQLATAALADQIVRRASAHAAISDGQGPRVAQVRARTVREAPPLLFDLTSLQRTANRRFGWSAQRTLDLAQALYERHKVLTYPRTDSRHLTSDVAQELPQLFAALSRVPELAPFAAPLVAAPPRPSARVVDDKKVSDHHAIIPTGKIGDLSRLDRDERRLFDLVARRFLGAFHPDAEFAVTEALISVGGDQRSPPASASPSDGDDGRPQMLAALPPPPDWFLARGRVRVRAGWQEVAGIDGGDGASGQGDGNGRGAARGDADADEGEPTTLLPPLVAGQRLDGKFASRSKKTQPPRRYTEASLLAAMESAGKGLTDEEQRAAMKDTGLGTPATRAAIIETLLKRGYAERDKKLIVPTATGIGLIDALPVQSLASPELTGTWEARLARIARGEETRLGFMSDIARYVQDTVDAIRGAESAPHLRVATRAPSPRAPTRRERTPRPRRAARPKQTRAAKAPVAELPCPRCGVGPLVAGKRGWGCARWREGCRFVIWFETAGRKLSDAQMRDLVLRGKTRRARFEPGGAPPVDGRLVLDVDGEGGARFVRDGSARRD